jgi:hypothetical protein
VGNVLDMTLMNETSDGLPTELGEFPLLPQGEQRRLAQRPAGVV